MVKLNFVKMTLQNKNKISLVIMSVTLVVLIVLCVTGFSFRNIRRSEQEQDKEQEQEHFLSNIKKWINGGDDDEVAPSNSGGNTNNMIIPPHAPGVNLPADEPMQQHDKILDTTNILNNVQEPMPSHMPSAMPPPMPPATTNNLIDMDKLNLQFFDANEKVEGDDYMYTGAEIGLTGANIRCGPSDMKAVKASGVAILDRDGSISDIEILNNGKGYKLPPIITISGGGGSGCKAKAVIDDDAKIAHFEILDGGNGYISTPNVIIEEPANNKLCKLYIKKN